MVAQVLETKRSSNHEITCQDDGVLIYRYGHGTATADDVTVLANFEKKYWDRLHVYSITFMDDGLSISPGALTRAARLYQHSPPRTSAVIVRRHYLRTAMEFFVRTSRFLGAKVDVGFFNDEQTARVWIEERRTERMNS